MSDIVPREFPDFNFADGEMLLINKPYKWTCFDVVGKIRGKIFVVENNG